MTAAQGRLMDQEWMLDPQTRRVMAALESSGQQARFVGGCVRNALVNRPVSDIDIATPLLPEAVIEHLQAAGIQSVPTGLLHGTITAVTEGKAFEITTLRRDVHGHGRHADVIFTDDWQLDAARRDFTINAMSCTLDGVVYDYFGGMQHLREGKVLFVGEPEQRIHEDYLRILRFFRFQAHFGQGAPDKAALKACQKNAKFLGRLSSERIRQETLKLLDSNQCAEIWSLMLDLGIVAHILPEGTKVARLKNLLKAENLLHVPPLAILRLASLLDTTETGFKNIVNALRLSTRETDHLHDLLFTPLPASRNDSALHLRQKTYRLGHDIVIGQLLLDVAETNDQKNLVATYQIVTSFRPPQFPLNGKDVMELGIPAGPDVGRFLAAMETWWLEHDFKPGRGECLEKLKDIILK